MDQVPTMISSKDLDYIKDMLNWNFIIIKKANHYLEHIQDEEVAALIGKVVEMHRKQFNTILGFLQ